MNPDTTSLFWVCECDLGYIHSSYVNQCGTCQAKRWDRPKARLEETIDELVKITQDPTVLIDTTQCNLIRSVVYHLRREDEERNANAARWRSAP